MIWLSQLPRNRVTMPLVVGPDRLWQWRLENPSVLYRLNSLRDLTELHYSETLLREDIMYSSPVWLLRDFLWLEDEKRSLKGRFVWWRDLDEMNKIKSFAGWVTGPGWATQSALVNIINCFILFNRDLNLLLRGRAVVRISFCKPFIWSNPRFTGHARITMTRPTLALWIVPIFNEIQCY
jgi:hypothetical protein